MKVDFNQVLSFIGKWLAVGVVVYFGWKIGGLIDGVVTFI